MTKPPKKCFFIFYTSHTNSGEKARPPNLYIWSERIAVFSLQFFRHFPLNHGHDGPQRPVINGVFLDPYKWPKINGSHWDYNPLVGAQLVFGSILRWWLPWISWHNSFCLGSIAYFRIGELGTHLSPRTEKNGSIPIPVARLWETDKRKLQQKKSFPNYQCLLNWH